MPRLDQGRVQQRAPLQDQPLGLQLGVHRLERLLQFGVRGLLCHLGQGLGDLVFGVVNVPKLVDEQFLQIFHFHDHVLLVYACGWPTVARIPARGF